MQKANKKHKNINDYAISTKYLQNPPKNQKIAKILPNIVKIILWACIISTFILLIDSMTKA